MTAFFPGHLWFLQLLLIFAAMVSIFKVRIGRGSETRSSPSYLGAFPSNKTLVLTIGVLALLTFAMRTVYPVGETILGMQPGHFIHYIAVSAIVIPLCFLLSIPIRRLPYTRRVLG